MEVFHINKKFFDVMGTYLVKSAEKELIFFTKIARPLSKYGYELWDGQGETHLCTMWRKRDKHAQVYRIEREGKEVASIRTNKGWKKDRFFIEPYGIEGQANPSKLSYECIQGEKVIAKIDTKLFRFTESFSITIESDMVEFLYIFIFLVIIIDRTDSSWKGILFKRF